MHQWAYLLANFHEHDLNHVGREKMMAYPEDLGQETGGFREGRTGRANLLDTGAGPDNCSITNKK